MVSPPALDVGLCVFVCLSVSHLRPMGLSVLPLPGSRLRFCIAVYLLTFSATEARIKGVISSRIELSHDSRTNNTDVRS